MNHHSRALVLAIGLAASILACQKRESASSETEVAITPVPEAGAPAPSTSASYDLQFLDSMSKHHQMAVDMAKMGQGKFAHKELESSAKKIAEKQESEIAQMKQWRDQWFRDAPVSEKMEIPGMESSKNMDMSHMQTMSGKDLDLMFINMMIPHHQTAISMAQDALVKAEHQEIKDLAQKIISDQQKEITQLEQWKSRWSAGK